MFTTTYPSASEFLDATAAFRAAEPVLTNLIGSVATGVVAGRRYESELWLTVNSGTSHSPGELVGIAMRTAPHNLVVSPMPLAAAAELGRALGGIDPDLPGVLGPTKTVTAVLDGLGARSRAQVRMAETAHVLGDLAPPAHRVPGMSRPVAPADYELVSEWLVAFAAEAQLQVQPTREAVRSGLADAARTLWVWDVDGLPVSLGGHAPAVLIPGSSPGSSLGSSVVRIGPIYTPAQHRGQGFASAITHALAADLQARYDVVMLHTDAANPTSNSIYRKLGFAEVASLVEVELAPIGQERAVT